MSDEDLPDGRTSVEQGKGHRSGELVRNALSEHGDVERDGELREALQEVCDDLW